MSFLGNSIFHLDLSLLILYVEMTKALLMMSLSSACMFIDLNLSLSQDMLGFRLKI